MSIDSALGIFLPLNGMRENKPEELLISKPRVFKCVFSSLIPRGQYQIGGLHFKKGKS